MQRIGLVSLLGNTEQDAADFGTLPAMPTRVRVSELEGFLQTSPNLLIVDTDDVVKLALFFPAGTKFSCPAIFCIPAGADGLAQYLSEPPQALILLKPFDPTVLSAYVTASLKPVVAPRAKNLDADQLCAGPSEVPIRLDGRTKQVTVVGRTVKLTPKEFALLKFLYREPGRVFSGAEIVDSVWAGKKRASALDVQQYIHHLRKKIEPDPSRPRYVKNVKGFGYTLDITRLG